MPLVTRSGVNATLFKGSAQPTMFSGNMWFDTGNIVMKYAENDTPTLRTVEKTSNKNVASGYAGLDSNSKVTLAQVLSHILTFN